MPRTKRADLQCNNAIGAAQERRSSGLIYLFENIVRKWRRRFSRSEWALRRLRLSPASGPSSEPGLLLIQIDGLSRDQMERAMVRGRLPFLRSLQQRQHYELTTFYSGLPSTTPAVQAELFYGVCCAVPAFSFLDRPTKRIATMYKPDWVKKVEADLQKQCTGLLAGGSSWSNIYTGGAALEESHFCAASIGPGDFLKSVSWWGLLSIILLHFPAVLRLLFLLVMEIFLALWDVMRGVWAGENFYQEIKFILSRLFVGVGLRELVTIGAAVDLARGLPIVHVNFLGYDEQSHRRGPDSAFAHWSLKGIDFAIKKLYIEAQRSHRREYRVWIFSDHGQERVRSFYEEFPGGIERVMHEALTQAPPPQGRRTRGSMRMSRADWMGDRRARRRLERAQKEESLSVEEETLFSVTALGPVGHVYLGQKTSVDEKLALAKWLVNRGGVPGVLMALSPAGGLWVHSKGVWRLPEEAREHLP
ncbi:MAG: alkaline phosphatase family protein, partial [Verrucomicrobiota bacterium]